MTPPPPSPSTETALRQRLGIPPDARQALIFAESSHWDPDWLYTSQEYFRRYVAPNLEAALRELRRDPRRVYSVECTFFLRLFWESRPDLQDELRGLLNARRLRLTGSGVTTPDTLLPSEEALLRDFLLGQEWLRSIGVTQEPRLAYFPDSFGHSPNLPALLNAAGFTRAAVSRIDGMGFIGADLELPGRFPLRGSSAERLLRREACLDFTWRAGDGSQVLCHWNAFTYAQGDLLADAGLVRIYLYPWLSRPDRSDRRVARRVAGYLRQLAPLSRTPYLLCPIGMDFNPPIPGLNELLDGYNRRVYPTSGVWLVNAGMDDYFDLIEPYRERLPTLALDPNPYWTGFYTARPALKERAFRLVERLSLCEQLGLLNGQAQAATQRPARAWWPAAVANHHDFITGTSPDRVAYGEQLPLLDEALAESGRALESPSAEVRLTPADPPAPALPQASFEGGDLRIRTPYFDLKLSALNGGSVESLRLAESGETLLEAGSHALAQYADSGGLWRMGYEYRGGRFRQARLDLPAVRFSAREESAWLRVDWRSELAGEALAQSLWVNREEARLYFQVEGRAPERTTLALRYGLPFHPRALGMEAPGGRVTRPLARVYRRVFWPAQRFLHAPNPDGGRGLALLLRFPGAVAVSEEGKVELVAFRNAVRERAYRLLPLPAMPAAGVERERTILRFALSFPRAEEAAALPAWSRELASAPWSTEEERLAEEVIHRLVAVDSGRVFASAIKPAWRGEGVILRLVAPDAPLPPVRVRWKGGMPGRAWLCDARERDLRPIEIEGEEMIVPLEHAVVTVRIENY